MLLKLYTFGIHIYSSLLFLAFPFNKKAKQIIRGRRDTFRRIKLFKDQFPNEKLIWMHCASLGEYEQGKSLLSNIRDTFPTYKIGLSFYSPSGFEHVINNDNVPADIIFYLPEDTPSSMGSLIEDLSPAILILVKYELWTNLIKSLSNRNIDILLVSASFRADQFFFKPWANHFLREIRKIKHFFVINKADASILHSNNIKNVTVSGDTRIASSLANKKEDQSFPKLNSYTKKFRKVFIYGSVWNDDMDVIKDFINNNDDILHLVAPHNVDSKSVLSVCKKLPIYNLWEEEWSSNTLVINKIGLLKHIYALADIVYIGGGFHNGLHNTLEPAVFGKPLLFGPDYHKFEEASTFVKMKLAISINSKLEFSQGVSYFLERPSIELSDTFELYFQKRVDSVQIIIDYLRHILKEG